MRRLKLRDSLPLWFVLALSACSQAPDAGSHAMFISAAESDAMAAGKIRLLSDEQDIAGGFIVYFDTDSAAVDARYLPRLEYVANYLAANPLAEVYVEGHTDAEGAPEPNFVLGEARADMIRYYLLKYGGLYDQVQVRSYGEQSPLVVDATQRAQQDNRRVVIEWTSQGLE